MAWKPKTVAGKILKGAVIGGGSLLALSTGNRVITNLVSKVTEKKGTAALAAGVGGSVNSLASFKDRFKEGAARLITGKTKEIRGKINQAREEARDLLMKQKAAEKLVSLGKSPAEARALAGLGAEEMPEVNGKPAKSNNMLMFGGLALGAILLLSKIGK
jgi:hypothetical protein